jgi:hypothetical protein
MSELQLYSFNLLVVDDLVIPLFSVICVSAGIAIRSFTILYISIRRCSHLRSDSGFQSNFFIISVTLVVLP